MNEIIERAARAFAANEGWEWSSLHETEDTSFGWGKRHIAIRMLQTIDIMREPTEGMLASANADPATAAVDGLVSVAAAHGATLSDFYRDDNIPLKRWWRAMIDAALTGKDGDH